MATIKGRKYTDTERLDALNRYLTKLEVRPTPKGRITITTAKGKIGLTNSLLRDLLDGLCASARQVIPQPATEKGA